jgi:hypothetical protein
MTTNNRNFKSEPRELRWDNATSTYWWIIWLNQNMEYNGKKQVEKIDGSSKPVGGTERPNKEQLLITHLNMFQTRGYIDRSNYIQIFHNRTGIINKATDRCILTLYPAGNCNCAEDYFTPAIQKALKDLFDLRDRFNKEAKGHSIIPYIKPDENDKKIFLDINAQASRIGNNFAQLEAYCKRLVRWGHSFAEATDFFNRYKATFLK